MLTNPIQLQFFLVAFLVHLVGIIYLATNYGATAVRCVSLD
jgi:hypothetical protein